MATKITELVDRIDRLERELLEEIRRQEESFHYRIEGTRVRFESAVAQAHRELRTALLPWLRSSQWRNALSAPIIYAMIVPLALLDLTITVYQHLCFRLYRIPRVVRARYVVLDRHQLAYLNGIEKLNCVYCGYGNGVVAYAREIIARTEQYWCPIKHARKVLGTHRRYARFANYGDAERYHEQALKLREDLRDREDDRP
ncbi:MAG TPA: hypothetical protein VLA56_10960 [Pseudomonadales bacterium]|nr:hypothetical protein [Pseudomonadales bacterium]